MDGFLPVSPSFTPNALYGFRFAGPFRHELQLVAQVDPLKHFLVITEGLFLKGMPLGDVLADMWPLLVIAAVALTGSALLFRSKLE